MADDFEEFDDDDFIVEDEESQSNRPFILAVMGLLGVLLVSVIILGVFTTFSGNGNDGGGEEVAQINEEQAAQATMISATNEAIETQNAYVTQTLESRRMTDEAPTATPTAVPPTETATLPPTETPEPEVEEASASDEEEGAEEGAEEVNADATSIFSGVNTVTPSPDDAAADASGNDDDSSGGELSESDAGSVDSSQADTAADAAADTAGSSSSTTTATDAAAVEELPDTGFGVWGAIVAAIALMVLLVGARRLRVQ